MSKPFPTALALSHRVLRILVAANIVYGVLILALLVASLVAPGPVFSALGVQPAPDMGALIRGMRLLMVVGLVGVPVAHVILIRLREIVDTVRAGDPFVSANAARLQTIAWCVLGLELLHLAVGSIAAGSASAAQPLDIDWTFSVTPWIAVLLLFVLARVFDHGARMREELEGTV
jgi:hypothetical protein